MNNIRALLIANRDKIIEAIKEAERLAYINTECEYRVYLDSEEEANHEEWPANDRGWYEFNEPYERHYIYTACHEYYDILWDWWLNETQFAKEAFEKRFGFEFNTDPIYEGGWEIDESLLESVYRQGREYGILSSEIDDWLDEETEDAIEVALEMMDWDKIIEEAIKDYCTMF